MPNSDEIEVKKVSEDNHEEIWSSGPLMVFLKIRENRFECFWYVDLSARMFVEIVGNMVTSAEVNYKQHVVRAAGSGLPNNEVFDLSLEEYGLIHDFDDLNYFELNLGGVHIYWAKERPPIDELEKQQHIIHVGGLPEMAPVIKEIYSRTCPGSQSVDCEELAAEIIDEIQRRK